MGAGKSAEREGMGMSACLIYLGRFLREFDYCFDCHVEMRFSIVVLCILVAILAIAVGRIYQRLFNVPVPENFPKNSTWQFKIVGFSFGLAKDLVSKLTDLTL